jgi:predicted nucleic-acid-binding protein
MSALFCIDANVWVQRFIGDEPHQADLATQFLDLTRTPRLYTTSFVLLETHLLLTTRYGFSKREAVEALEIIRDRPGLRLLESSDFFVALRLHQEYEVKLVSCLIATQLRSDMCMVTFDKEFKKLPGVLSCSPEELI